MTGHSSPAPRRAFGNARPLRTSLALGTLLVLSACGGGGGGGGGAGSSTGSGTGTAVGTASDTDGRVANDNPDTASEDTTPVTEALAPGPNGSYLFVSAPEFYFGTRDIGTRSTQQIELTNRGGDIYPIHSVVVTGDNAEEFVTDLRDPVTLNPAERVSIGVTFAPIGQGRKFAALDIDFDTIVQVDEATNIAEQTFYRARDLERRREYQGARDAYEDYIASDPVTVNEQRAAIRLPVIDEGERYGSEDDFALYLEAMAARDVDDLDVASNALDTLLLLHADGYLADDALYLKGYIALMDEKDYAAALRHFQQLRTQYPDTSYYDTALYGEALAQQGLGNDVVARSVFLDLRYRHTGVDAFGVTLPKDELLSRLWFDRANAGLEALDAG